MKQLFLFALTIAVFASCSKNQNDDVVTENRPVTIRFTQSNTFARSLFDNTAVAQPWEKTVNSISLYFYDAAKLLVKRNLTAGEIAAGKVIFALPRSFSGTGNIYAVANYSITEDVSAESSIRAILEKTPEAYNGTIEEVSSLSMRNGGFVLSGFVSHNFSSSVSDKTELSIALRRTVAKVQLKTVIDPLFYRKYPGKVKIIDAQVKKAAAQSALFDHVMPNTGAMNYSHAQAPMLHENDSFNLFYVYENGGLPAESSVMIEVTGLWDRDGNFNTIADQEIVTYHVPVAGTEYGEIKRNGCYFITANITGLGGNALDCTMVVSDWESPVNESVQVGF